MFATFLFVHSIIRWFVLASLFISLYRAYRGYVGLLTFTTADNAMRNWTATIAHGQLVVGIYIYTQSDTVKSLFKGMASTNKINEPVFFGMIHISLMLIAIIMITIGSAKAKRKTADKDKFKTMLIWFGLALAVIFLAIPWPFSPLAQRPLLRSI